MPTMKSAKKRLRQNIKLNLRNRSHRSALKTQIKDFLGIVKAGTVQAAEEKLRLTMKKLDKAAAKGILHKKTASRRKSRLTLKLNQMKATTQQKT
ncbi:30S ribosomal protein S20 [Candidatus Brocadia sapporoensis]|uniref:Small ribosomal subunit protein bS20 n=1 Tax=Candidatus Brocadia sapporoensis TaxID=392547 RepID=A0A1V6M3M9_9BACT|nr:30S ribosomal protein S20 [Candidatus Brocadia sapporoensis]MDG6005495.1 30S ribosomal protein S20 [Candidatus Brocadia sp.]MEB2308154.1 30S ribosomal protein S20 [Candidatus Brocadiaceae bacterium]OQZ04565.1 MAG: 30S ribosomal protein S20 [Candidatus Brocadia sp. UTAMX1]RZV57662.1 MAG: 30S ribosomal protein S20 [Candidatus Brocadia sp. BROELEC01]TWU52970.1 30S ribosomal protein S20 [Candidatus Brocadiaceae bacterium B188]